MTQASDPRPAPGQALTVTEAEGAAPDAPAIRDYDPADYRWVPVRRVPRSDGWTEEKQRRFIETLADTGLVGLAAKEVGLSREAAYRLRRSPHGAAFARAWDAARHHAGGLIEDIAFERAIQGVEQEVYNDCGEVVASRLVHDTRLLKYLLSHLKPDRYGTARGAAAPGGDRRPAPEPDPAPEAAPPAIAPAAVPAPVPPTASALEASLRAMEPALPAPPDRLLAPDALADAFELADICDGALPHFLTEQRPPRSEASLRAEADTARHARGAAARARRKAGHRLTDEELADECFHIDPVSNARRRKRPRR